MTLLTAFCVLASALLIGVFAVRLFDRRGAGIVAAVLFAATPLAFLAARGGAPQVVLVPFMLIWLLAFDQFYRSDGYRWLAVGGASLAMMVYLHLAGLVIAPAYFAVGACALAWRRDRVPAMAMFAAGFVVFASPKAVAFLTDGQPLRDAINAYGLYDANRFNLWQGIREITSWTGLTARAEVYWDSLNPALLFLGRGEFSDVVFGSRVFLLPIAVPFVRGLLAYLKEPRGAMDWVLLGSLLIAPAVPALLAQPPVPQRLMMLAAIMAIIAARGCYPGALSSRAAGSPPTPGTVAISR